MAWTKRFTNQTATQPQAQSPLDFAALMENRGTYRNYESTLPEVYIGHPNRSERYNQYEQMDMDSEISAALEIISEFSTQKNIENGTAFDIQFKDRPTDTEIAIIKEQLKNWVALNQFDRRLFKLFRNVLKYGDQIFVRDPETFELYWVEMSKVVKVIVNEHEGKKPEQYILSEIAPNFQNLTMTAISTSDTFANHPQVGGPSGAYVQPRVPYSGGNRFSVANNENAIAAEHVVHLSLTEGLDVNWPFGNSILEKVFKVFKQKELLEDAILIYRIQRAPERRVFKIDVGDMPSHMAMAYVERVKNEIHQRRIPTQTGGGATVMDATYNPMSTLEDYFFPVTADGRGSSVDVMQGGSQLGEIDDLKFFTNKLSRGLGIPSSYLPTGSDDGTQTFNDGRVGTALIQEWRFNQTCKRLQELVCHTLDKEFKMFMRWRGLNIDNGLFDLKFNEPQNFSKYRQVEIDNARIQGFQQLEPVQYLSKRFLLQRYLGLSEEEMLENETLWREEHAEDTQAVISDSNNIGLRAAGVSPDDIGSDIENFEMAAAPPPDAEAETPAGTGVAPTMSQAAPASNAAPTPSPVPGGV
jgi:hypothetical protein